MILSKINNGLHIAWANWQLFNPQLTWPLSSIWCHGHQLHLLTWHLWSILLVFLLFLKNKLYILRAVLGYSSTEHKRFLIYLLLHMHSLLQYQHLALKWYFGYNWWTYIDTPLSLKVQVYIKVHSWCCIFYEFGQMCNDMYPPLSYTVAALP